MSYLDSYKKRLLNKGGDIRGYREKQAMDTVNRNFELSHGYIKGTIIRPEVYMIEETEAITKNISGELQKYFMFRPKTKIEVGSYLSYEGNTYILRDFEEDLVTPTARGYFCNNAISFKGGVTLPCWASNSTYGSKGISDVDKFMILDAKLKIYIQKNPYTDTLKIGHRIMLANRYVFKITELDNLVYGTGLYVLVTTRDELMPMDNLEENIAWNEFDNQEEIVENEIVGSERLNLGSVSTYIFPFDAEWSVDDETYAQIVSQANKEVEVKGLKKGWVEIQAKHGDVVYTKEVLVC